MNVLTTENLTKSYKGIKAVDGVSMHIEKGDIYGFVGENGAGKTTVIRLITGLAEPTAGTFSLFGADRRSPEILAARKRTGGIVEAVSLNRGMTALQNLRLQCSITGTEKTDDELKALLTLVGLDPETLAKRKSGNFSLGMRQRLGIAMAMVSSPEFIILDEPMNGLDPTGFVEVRETILRLHRMGVTFLISSHILSELDKVCTKIGVISGGRLLREMSMEELHGNAGRRTALQTDSAEAAAVLAQTLAVGLGEQNVSAAGDTVTVNGEGDLNELLRLALTGGVRLNRVNVTENTVEDFYMSIVKGGARK